MSSQDQITTGSCLCGNIKYSFRGDPKASVVCHCLHCKRTTGGPVGAGLILPAATADFKTTAGEPSTYEFVGGSGRRCVSHFCGTCGSSVYVVGSGSGSNDSGSSSSSSIGGGSNGIVVVKPGTLDDWRLAQTARFRPTKEIYCVSRLSWMPAVEGVAAFDGSEIHSSGPKSSSST